LLATIPVPPGATVERQSSSAYYVGETDEVGGYSTNTVYAVSGMTDEEVYEFYVDELGGEWEYCRDDLPIIEPVERGQPEPTPLGYILTANFIRGDALINVHMEGLAEALPGGRANGGQYELVVDHDSGRDFCARAE